MNRQNKWPRTMAIASIVGLAIFFGFWNYKVYQEAKAKLKDEIQIHLESANHEFSSLQINRLFSGLGGQTTLDVGIDLKGDSISEIQTSVWFNSDSLKSQEHRFFNPKQLQSDSAAVMVVWDERSQIMGIDSSQKNSFRFEQIIEVDSAKTSWGREDFFGSLYNNNEKGKKIDSLFRQKLQKHQLPFDYVFTYGKKDSINTGLVVTSTTSDYVPKSLSVRFENYTPHLFAELLPSLLLSCLLFLLVVTAFVVILKNWKKQIELARIKNDFMSNITHELKTPISTVSIALEAIQDHGVLDDKEKTLDYLSISKKELNRLSLLVEKVLRAAVLDDGKIKLKEENVNLSGELRNVLETMEMHFEENNAQVECDIENGNQIVLGDKVHIGNIIFNLLENALKYSKGNPQIEVSLKSLSEVIVLEIKDNGKGISPSDQEKIFDKFYRVSNNDHHDTKGHGLGLSYVKNVIEKMGGSISVDSKLNQGSTFRIQLNKVK